MNHKLNCMLPTIAVACLSAANVAFTQSSNWDKYNNAGRIAYEEGHYDEAEKSWSLGLEEAEKLGPDDSRLATSLHNMATVYSTQSKLAEIEQVYKRAATIYEKAQGHSHRDLAYTLNKLALLYMGLGRKAEAEPLV